MDSFFISSPGYRSSSGIVTELEEEFMKIWDRERTDKTQLLKK